MNKLFLSMIMAACITTSANAVDWPATAQRVALGPVAHLAGAGAAARYALATLAPSSSKLFTKDGFADVLGKSVTQVTSKPLSQDSLIGCAMLFCAGRLAYLGLKETKEEANKVGLKIQSPVTTK